MLALAYALEVVVVVWHIHFHRLMPFVDLFLWAFQSIIKPTLLPAFFYALHCFLSFFENQHGISSLFTASIFQVKQRLPVVIPVVAVYLTSYILQGRSRPCCSVLDSA